MAFPSDKPLPHNLDAEKSILGAILLDNQAFARAVDKGIRADDFHLPEHRRIFAAMDTVREDGFAVDLVTLTEFLLNNQQLDACGGSGYISALVDGVPAITNVEHYARIVKEKAELRELIREMFRLQTVAQSGITPPGDIRGQIELLLKTSSNGHHKARLIAVDVLKFLAMKLNPVEFVVDPVVPVQGLVMVFAKRGIGKTYFIMTLAYDVALGSEKCFEWRIPKARRVLLVDGEMPANVLQERLQNIMKGSGGRVPEPDMLRFITPDLQEIRSANISTSEGQRMIEEYLQEGNFLILDNLSALSRGGKENEAESWDAIQEWFLHLRQRMISVVLLHHAGKSGTQRGTGKREDVLDTIIELRSPSDYDQSAEGSRFEVHFDKMRRTAGGNLIYPFEARLDQNGATRGVTWTMKPLRDVLEQRAFDCFTAGMNPRDVCDELHINRFKAHRLRKKWDQMRNEIK